MPTPGFRYKPLGPKPRASRAKSRKTHTCPICAETFTASRSDQRFCDNTCRKRAARGSIPEAVAKQAEEIRAKRTESRRKAAEKRLRDKQNREANANRIAAEKAENAAKMVEKAQRVLAMLREKGVI